MSIERVQKILSQAGIASRRKAEELIADGEVTINGKIAKLGDKADINEDSIKVKGKLLRQLDPPVYIAFHKPKGVISMWEDPQGRSTLADFFKKIKTRVFPVGRLDFNSEGLLLLTNDGALAERLQKEDTILKLYTVKIKGHPDAEMMARLERGYRPPGPGKRLVRAHSVRVVQKLTQKSMIEMGFLGAGSVDIKALFESRGFLVEKVIRSAIGHLTLKGLPAGEYRHLKYSQIEALLEQPELGLRRLDQELKKKSHVR